MGPVEIPEHIDGTRIRAVRAAEQPDAPLVVECVDDEGHVRAGHLDTTGDRPRLTLVERDPTLPVPDDGATLAHHLRHHVWLRVHGADQLVVPEREAPALRARAVAAADAARRAGFLAERWAEVAPGRLAVERPAGQPCTDPGDPHWETLWPDWAERWARFCAQPADALPAHPAAAEVQCTRHAIDTAVAHGLLRLDEGTPRDTFRRVTDAFAEDAQGTAPAVGGLEPGQLLHDAATGTLALTGLTGARAAEPALDLAELAVHAILAVARDHWSRDAGDAVLHAVMVAAGLLAVPPARLQLAQAVVALRLGGELALQPGGARFAARWCETWLTKPVVG